MVHDFDAIKLGGEGMVHDIDVVGNELLQTAEGILLMGAHGPRSLHILILDDKKDV